MTRDDIIRMMRSACDTDKVDAWHNEFWTVTQDELERFAALVAVAELRRLHAENEALRRDAERLTDEQIDSATSKERDDLLDHIYEYGTAAEGILERIRKLARAAIDAARGE